jgi:peroxiredoxin
MSTRTATRRIETQRQQAAAAARRRQAQRARRRSIVISAVVIVAVATVVGVMMATSRPTSSTVTRTAPDFTLTDTAGNQVHLADYRGRNVVIYFSEGAGCGSCIQQMTAIEHDKAAFQKAGITVLPVVMNTRDQILRDMKQYGATTPFLLDDGKVSRAYGTLGRGMHAGLPGHSFVLIDKTGVQRWFGEYPSMWLEPSALIKQVEKHLSA